MPIARLLVVLTVVGFLTAASPVSAALITFSALHNGVTSATDPENFTTGNAIPSNYQPLQNAYPAPGGNFDGADIDVNITWADTQIAATPFPGVSDHTHLVSTDTAGVLGYNDFDTHALMDVRFDQPIEIASMYFANYAGGTGKSITFNGYTNVGDLVPAVIVARTYDQTTGPNGGGYQWIFEAGLAGVPIQQLVIIGTAYLQTDDWTVNVVPEPSSMAMLTCGIIGLLATSRRRRV